MFTYAHLFLLIIATVGFLPFTLFRYQEKHPNLRTVVITENNKTQRIAVLSVFMAKSLPTWFDLFAITVGNNQKYIDWFIFTLENVSVSIPHLPMNIDIIPLTSTKLSHVLGMVDVDYRVAHAKGNVTYTAEVRDIVQNILERFPYVLVEFKPALGDLFMPYIEQYGYFAYADMDILLGDWNAVAWSRVLREHHIVTLTFGDHYSLYLRGQMTIFRNTHAMRTLYRKCPHLTHFRARGEIFLSGARQSKWALQSAEGCISWIAHKEGLSILYLPLQRSDAYRGGKKEVAVLSKSDHVGSDMKLVYCQYDARSEASMLRTARILIPSREDMISYGQKSQVQVGVKAADTRCSYWIDPNYDVCALSFIPPTAIIAVYNYQVYFMNLSAPFRPLAGLSKLVVYGASNNIACYESLLFHMQVLKRRLYPSTSGLGSRNYSIAITSAGLIPFVSNPDSSVAVRQSYCLRYDAQLLHCECSLLAGSVKEVQHSEQNGTHISSSAAVRTVFDLSISAPIINVNSNAANLTLKISPPTCSYPSISAPVLYNIYFDRLNEKDLNVSLPWIFKLHRFSHHIVFHQGGVVSIDETNAPANNGALLVLIQPPASLPQHLLRFPEELLALPLLSSCPLLQLYLPRLLLYNHHGLLLLLLHFHLLATHIEQRQLHRLISSWVLGQGE
eukprot:gene25271-30516_t